MTLRAAAVQFFATPFALERNLQTAERLVREAAASGAQVIVLPELFNTGYVYASRLPTVAESEDGPTTQWLTRLATELQIMLGGALLTRTGDKIFDSFVLAEPNGKVWRYSKQHPFLWERPFFQAGQGAGLFETAFGRVGVLVGWDGAFRAAWVDLRGKADLILVSSAAPRLHRAVLNFPEAKKVYLADLLPEVLSTRDTLDDWFLGGIGQGAALAQAPVVSATLAGRFVTQLPYPRLSFALLALNRPRYLNWTPKASQATLRATFSGTSAIFDSAGRQLAVVPAEESIIGSSIEAATPIGQAAPRPSSPYLFSHIPSALLRLDSIFSLFVKPFSNPIS
jgi:predicted amidohydrolase